jgi:hypothetical protein
MGGAYYQRMVDFVGGRRYPSPQGFGLPYFTHRLENLEQKKCKGFPQ